MYRNEVDMQELNNETRKTLELDLKLYGFDLTLEALEQQLTLDEEPIIDSQLHKEVQLIACKKVYINQRGTLKLAVWKNGMFTLFRKDATPTSMPRVNTPYKYDNNIIWDDLKEGMYVVFYPPWGGRLKIGTLTDCMNKTEAEEWLRLYKTCLRKIENYKGYEETHSVSNIENTGFLQRQELKEWQERIDQVIIEIQKLEKEEKEKEAIALSQVTITGTKTVVKALDGHTYTIEVPTTPWTQKDWVSFVYRHRYQWRPIDQQNCKEQTLFNHVLSKLVNTPLEWFKLSVDSKDPVKVAIKNVLNKKGQQITLAYLDDMRVGYYEMLESLYRYFIEGEKLQTPNSEQSLEIRKQRDDTIINSGITGYIKDLEGEIPITLGFEKKGNSWYLVVGERKLHLKGGFETIRSLERVLKGTAQEYSARHSTQELYKRLAKELGSDLALQVIIEAKEMGILFKALGNKE